MSESDNFILRWARLKREAQIDHAVGNDSSLKDSAEPQQAVLVEPEAAPAQPRLDAADSEPFDPSSLPSIEAITAETDVRGFLQSRVPTELTIAALRRVWASDPAIRDFIGIAENQWDFNDPNAMPGFGPLGVTGNEPATLTKVLGEFVPGTPSKLPASEKPALRPVTGSSQSPVHEPAQQNVVEPASADANRRSNQQRVTGAEQERAVTVDDLVAKRRHHGSASPH